VIELPSVLLGSIESDRDLLHHGLLADDVPNRRGACLVDVGLAFVIHAGDLSFGFGQFSSCGGTMF